MNRLLRILLPWKWVIAYTILLFLSLSFARQLVDWLVERNLSTILGGSLVFIATGCVVFLCRRIRQNQGHFSFFSLLYLIAFLAAYACCVFAAASSIVERIHFVEYGILGGLCFRAIGSHHGRIRRAVYATVAVFFIGFLDEVIQGLLSTRYYDILDIRLNLIAGALPLLGILCLPLGIKEQESVGPNRSLSTTGREAPEQAPFVGPADLALLLLIIVLLFLNAWIARAEWDPGLLVGQWERENSCGRLETVDIQKDGTILWKDTAGQQARGRYQIGGNRLDGAQLQVEVLAGGGAQEDACAWKMNEIRHRYFEVDGKKLLFKKEPSFPYRRSR